ncbi:MAG: hypothetical protein J7M26_02040, partial [Armatimonadetes bacterium]|nr:hypothetical protein [Armatimonadota bacterium]
RGQGMAVQVRVVVLPEGGVLFATDALSGSVTTDLELALEHGSGMSLVALSADSLCQKTSASVAQRHVRLHPGPQTMAALVSPRDWRIERLAAARGLCLQIARPGDSSCWRVALNCGEQAGELTALGITAVSDFLVAHYAKPGKVDGVLLVGVSQIRRAGQVLVEATAPSNLWWTPTSGPHVAGAETKDRSVASP